MTTTTAVERLRQLGETVPDDPIEAAVDWLRWCVAERVLAANGACATQERAAQAELDALEALLKLCKKGTP